jgi:basic membrane lipoprotein Med (substrate-binding protein (PBP1-ABC) superfamily)
MIIGIHITHRQAYRALVGTEYEGSGIKFVVGGEFALNAVEAGVSTDDVGVCFPKLYESRFLSGLMAGYMTRTGVIGYVISVTIPQTLRQVRALLA